MHADNNDVNRSVYRLLNALEYGRGLGDPRDGGLVNDDDLASSPYAS